MTSKQILPTMATALSLLLATAAFAADEYNVANGLTLNGNPLGMHGNDPVSMSQGANPAQGDAAFTSSHDGIDYYFTSAEAKAMFDTDPLAYLPQFGGFCAFGVYVGKKLDGDVRYADIVEGKLYLFVNAAILAKYLEDPEAVIAGANAKWQGIVNTPVRDL
ncbi:YHS domain-containing protein [Roseovarius marisflavi]|uniref:YHS domain-containing protein n=1 Tax=Roseovarius marisflavi TaxID=1054996 RepID=A0A1M7DQ95_9RHOB|nr:YHS domain-containing (seleno)protein [Roseovarius marisflavi]SHL81349.1 YHS domain-containing protein [Roseovarius marisflavi]